MKTPLVHLALFSGFFASCLFRRGAGVPNAYFAVRDLEEIELRVRWGQGPGAGSCLLSSRLKPVHF